MLVSVLFSACAPVATPAIPATVAPTTVVLIAHNADWTPAMQPINGLDMMLVAADSIVIVGGLVIGLISWAISILLSFPITGILTYGGGMAVLTTPMPALYGMSGVIAWLIFTLILTTIASALPARRASRLTVRDTLAYE